MSSLKEKLIVALDFQDFDSAKNMVEFLGDEVSFYKIGLELMASGDYFKMIKYLKSQNKKVFADLKLYDIGATIAKTVKNLSKHNIDLLTIHGANSEIMEQAALNKNEMKILAVTVLTCLEKNDLTQMGFDQELSVQDLVLKKAKTAIDAKIDGVISSVLEANFLRKNLGQDFLITTPGIRLESNQNDDQKRVATPSDAINSGANYIVVGRPITQSKNPKESAKIFHQKIRQSLS